MELHRKYRPVAFEEVIGQDPVIESLREVVKSRDNHSFVFTGPSGVGKTTLARILALELGCDGRNLIEVDAATFTGIDDWRQIRDGLRYAPIGESKVKFVIVDEAHALSKNAWQSLLKDVEEPPPHVYWAFCTTESGRIPPTILTRCVKYDLSLVRPDDICDLLVQVCKAEGGGPAEEILHFIARNCNGSVREALVSLATCWTATDTKTAGRLMSAAAEEGDVIHLLRALTKGGLTWTKAAQMLNSLEGSNAEGLRLTAQAYFLKVLLGTASPEQAVRVLPILDAFSRPYPPGTSLAPFVLDVASLVFASEGQ